MLLDSCEPPPIVPRTPPLWRIVRVAFLLGLLSFASRQLNQGSWAAGGVTILWPSNGLLMAILLCNPRRQWPAYIAVACGIDLVVNFSLNDPFHIAAYLSGCNMLEAVLGAVLLYPAIAQRPDLTERKQLAAFLGYGVLLAPAVASLAASFAQGGQFAVSRGYDFLRWFTADALGIATVAPFYMAFDRPDCFANRSRREILALFALLAAVTLAVFWQTRFPFLFVVTPFLLLLGLRLGLAGSAMGLLLVSIVGGFLSTWGRGPIGLVHTHSFAERDLTFQSFIAISMLVLYVLEVLQCEGKQVQTHLEGSEKRFRLLAEASSDIIFLNDLYGKRTYVSPSVVGVLGWSTDEILAGTYRDLVHPDDSAALERMLNSYREHHTPAPPEEFRYLKADGAYVWLEFNMRIYYDDDTGKPGGFVNVARDISRRKMEEADYQRTFETVEHLASSDPLTGIANRRQFDMVFEREWLRAARERTPLSLLLLDIDRFKRYNDIYGHLTGDECLRQVVAAIQPVVSRPADLLARYGGEEFVVVLPNTTAAGARQLAEWIRFAVESSRLPHSDNPPHSVITLSIGCATLIPHPAITHLQLLEGADQALYRAKSSGRNCIQSAEAYPNAASVLLRG